MMCIQPIPREMLPHKIEVTGETLNDWGEYITPDDATSYELDPVRLDLGAELKITRQDQEITARGILFVDQETHPDFKGLAVGEIIKHDGERYTVVACDSIYADRRDRPHHYEIGVL